MNGCPRCGGWVREVLAPGSFRCTTKMFEGKTCGYEYETETASGVCHCGKATLAMCNTCLRPICSEHSRIRQLKRFCHKHADAPRTMPEPKPPMPVEAMPSLERDGGSDGSSDGGSDGSSDGGSDGSSDGGARGSDDDAMPVGPPRTGAAGVTTVLDVDAAVRRAVERERAAEDALIREEKRRERWSDPKRTSLIEKAVRTFLRLANDAGAPGAQLLHGAGALRKGWEIARYRHGGSPKSFLLFLRTNGDLYYGDTQWGIRGRYELGGECIVSELERDAYCAAEDTIPVRLADLCVQLGLGGR